MKNITEILERYYQSLEKQTNPWDFFLALTNYVSFVKETRELKEALIPIITEKNKILERIEKQVKQTLPELEDAKKQLIKIIKEKNISHPELKEKIICIESFLSQKDKWFEGRTLIESVQETNRLLGEVAKIISKAGYYKQVRQFKNTMIYQNIESLELATKDEFIFSKTLLEEGLSARCLIQNRETELWGCWDYLNLVPEAFLNDHELAVCTYALPDWRDDGLINEYFDLLQVIGMIRRFHLIAPKKAGLDAEKKIREKINVYKRSSLRIHNYLIQELSKKEGKETIKKQIKENVVYLNQIGDLYQKPKNKYCYPMKKDSNLNKIVRYFAENKIYTYYPTQQITMGLERSNTTDLMKDIGKINQRVLNKLNIKEKIIEGRKGSGYRINPKYKITLEKE